MREGKTKPERVALGPAWMPATEIERAVYAALILAGEPVNNRRLAELMGCSRERPQSGSLRSKEQSARPARVARS